jgi:hypothetical protein
MIHVDFSRPLKVLKMSENLLINQQNVKDRKIKFNINPGSHKNTLCGRHFPYPGCFSPSVI